MTSQTPAAHARLSPSGSKRWFACPGSLTLAEDYPDEPNVYSDEGTAMHDVAAQVLLSITPGLTAASFIGSWITVSRPGEEPTRKVQIDEDMADLVQAYVDMVLARSAGHELLVEQRVEFSKFVGLPDQFGTADMLVIERDGALRPVTLVCGDLKTGHKPVHVEGNSQALTYALGALGDMYERAMAGARAELEKDLRALHAEAVKTLAQPEDDDDLAG